MFAAAVPEGACSCAAPSFDTRAAAHGAPAAAAPACPSKRRRAALSGRPPRPASCRCLISSPSAEDAGVAGQRHFALVHFLDLFLLRVNGESVRKPRYGIVELERHL